MARKQKLPLFRFVMGNVLGIQLISEGIVFDSEKRLIEETKKYDLVQDCNGRHIELAKNQNGKMLASFKTK